jgi:hypothetical protein
MSDKRTRAQLYEMLAEAVRNTQPQPVHIAHPEPKRKTQPRNTRPAPKRTAKIKSVRASPRRKLRRR